MNQENNVAGDDIPADASENTEHANVDRHKAHADELVRRDEKRRHFILNGNLWKVIIAISLPLMLINAFNFLYTIIDSVFASEINTDAISAVTVLTQINTMIASLGSGLASGGMIIISRLIGRNDIDRAKRAASTLVFLAAAFAVVMIAVAVPLTPWILRLARTPSDLIEIGTRYFMLQTVMSGVALFNGIFLGLEKARGRAISVLFYNLSVMALKIALSAVFVYGMRTKDLSMISLSTLLANLALTAYMLIRLALPSYFFRFSFKKLELKSVFLKPIAVISFPIFLGRFVFSLGKVIVNALCAVYGKKVVGALGVSNNLGGYTTNVIGSVEESESLIISTNLGQKNAKRAIKAFFYCTAFNVAIAVVGVLLLSIFDDPIVKFYAKGDAEFAEMISKIFAFEKLGIVALAINSSVLGLLYGFGYTRVSMAVNLSRLFVFRIPSLLIMMYATNIGYESVGIAMMISNICIGCMSIVIAIIYLLKIKRENITDNLKIG